jgi:hypothetical protein
MESAQMNASETHPGRLAAIAAVQRELGEMAAADQAIATGLRLRSARAKGRSVVYPIRRDPGEVEALEHRAAVDGLNHGDRMLTADHPETP